MMADKVCFPPTCSHKRDRGSIPKAAWRLSAQADVHSSDRERLGLGRVMNRMPCKETLCGAVILPSHTALAKSAGGIFGGIPPEHRDMKPQNSDVYLMPFDCHPRQISSNALKIPEPLLFQHRAALDCYKICYKRGGGEAGSKPEASLHSRRHLLLSTRGAQGCPPCVWRKA